jgi:LacI family transcriptional regulator, galactose operon repressor
VLLAGTRRLRGIDYVAADNTGGTRAATRHLLEAHGYRRLAFVAGPRNSPDARARFAGFRAALTEAGRQAPARPDVHGDFTERGGLLAVRELLRRGKAPEALVVGNDQMAVGAMAALAEAGLSVPEDVALTGFDDIQLARHVRPALTTVHQPMRELGSECVRLLLRRLAEPGAPAATVLLPTELVVRSSCGCAESGSQR